MKKIILNYGGIIFFYLVIVLGIMFINYDSNYFQKSNTSILSENVVINK